GRRSAGFVEVAVPRRGERRHLGDLQRLGPALADRGVAGHHLRHRTRRGERLEGAGPTVVVEVQPRHSVTRLSPRGSASINCLRSDDRSTVVISVRPSCLTTTRSDTPKRTTASSLPLPPPPTACTPLPRAS